MGLYVSMEDTLIDLVLGDTKESWFLKSIPTDIQNPNPILFLPPQLGQQFTYHTSDPLTPPHQPNTISTNGNH